jgi:hypothetical protein
MSPFSSKNGVEGRNPTFFFVLSSDKDFHKWFENLQTNLRDKLGPVATLGINAVFALVNHPDNQLFDKEKGATLTTWYHRAFAKKIGIDPDDFLQDPTNCSMASMNLDDSIIDSLRKLVHKKYHIVIDKAIQTWKAEQNAPQMTEHTDEDTDEDEPPPAKIGKRTKAASKNKKEHLENVPEHIDSATPHFKATAVILGLLNHFAPRGAAGVAFLITDTMHKLQAFMRGVMDGKTPAQITQMAADTVTACDTVGDTTLPLNCLCGIVAAAVLASSESALSDAGGTLLDALDKADLQKGEVFDISDVHNAMHQRQQIMEQAGNAAKGTRSAASPFLKNREKLALSAVFAGFLANQWKRV